MTPTRSRSHSGGGHSDPRTSGVLLGQGRGHDLLGAVFLGGRRRRIFGRLAAQSGARPGDRVLDVGCGGGHLTRVMAAAVSPGGSARGVDPSAEAIAYARRLTRAANCTFADGIAENLDAADGSYDVVVSSLMVHHLPEDVRPRVFAELWRVLRPGGTLLIAEFRPPASRAGRRLIGAMHGPAMANNRLDLLPPMIEDAGFVRLRTGDLRPWTHFVRAQKPTGLVG